MTTTISNDLLRSIAPIRETGAHKWGVGGVLVIAGAPQFPGAAFLASRSAGRNGAGIVYMATPRSVVGIMASAMPEVAFVPMPDSDAPASARRAIERMDDAIGKVASIVIGPGLGDDDSTAFLLTEFFGFGGASHRSLAGFGFGAEPAAFDEADSVFGRFAGQIVLDADGLNWLARQDDWWRRVPPHRLVLTPHPGEAQRLSGTSIEEIVADPASVAAELAATWQQTVVIKSGFAAASDGSQTIVADYAPTSLATAGSGDVFAGAIGAYLAQGAPPLDAVTLAIGVGGRAAIALEKKFGAAGVIATDLPNAMARAMHNLKIADNGGGGN